MSNTPRFITSSICFALAIGGGFAVAANCKVTSVNKTPISDLGPGLYLNQFQGGLYPNGSNDMPAEHDAVGLQRAGAIQPLNTQGQPDPANGKYVLLSIGMSNATQEYSRFQQLAHTNPQVNHSKLVIVDGAQGGQSAGAWLSPNAQTFNVVRDQRLAPWGLTEAQVQAVWIKQANPGPNSSLPNANADAYTLLGQLGAIIRNVKIRYPNVKIVFLSSRIYAGYASTTLNPEPYAYESAFSVKWLIEAQINQMSTPGNPPHAIAGDLNYNSVAPWIAWGPYLWADGLAPRSDGLIWECSNLANDGTHPSESGRTKVAQQLLTFLLNSPHSEGWFGGRPGDATSDGVVNVADLLAVISAWGPCPSPCPARCAADVAPIPGDCGVNVNDLLMVINNWG